jgi:hypothetical protein
LGVGCICQGGVAKRGANVADALHDRVLGHEQVGPDCLKVERLFRKRRLREQEEQNSASGPVKAF